MIFDASQFFNDDHDDVIRVLTRAFEAGCTRSDTWNLTNLSGEPLNTAVYAASIFKRGIPTIPEIPDLKKFKSQALELVPEIVFSNVSIVDENVFNKWEKLFPDKQKCLIVDNVTEENKGFKMLSAVNRFLASHPQATVDIIGGGLVSDVALFACSQLKQPYRLFPSSLLAMVDASIGGKCGINFPPFGKNQLGAFNFASPIHIHLDFLKTLDQDQLKSGLGECLKHGLLSGDTQILKAIKRITDLTHPINFMFIERVASFKLKVVEIDPFESHMRKILNYGHTFGHGIESFSTAIQQRPGLPHGQAVVLGMLFADFMTSYKLNPSNPELNRSQVILESGLLPDWKLIENLLEADKIFEQMTHDKKNSETMQMVLLESPGQLLENQPTHSFSHETMKSCIQKFCRILKAKNGYS